MLAKNLRNEQYNAKFGHLQSTSLILAKCSCRRPETIASELIKILWRKAQIMTADDVSSFLDKSRKSSFFYHMLQLIQIFLTSVLVPYHSAVLWILKRENSKTMEELQLVLAKKLKKNQMVQKMWNLFLFQQFSRLHGNARDEDLKQFSKTYYNT